MRLLVTMLLLTGLINVNAATEPARSNVPPMPPVNSEKDWDFAKPENFEKFYAFALKSSRAYLQTGKPGYEDPADKAHWDLAFSYYYAIFDFTHTLRMRNAKVPFKLPRTISFDVFLDAVHEYIEAHPKVVHQYSSDIIYSALSAKFPNPAYKRKRR